MDDRELRRVSGAQIHFAAFLEWENLTAVTRATSKAPSKEILCRSSGLVKSGEFLAIMGPSGAGKTTLLSYISGKPQATLFKESGEILLNKIPIDKLFYKAMIGFVPQQDIILESLTPREAFRFTAQFTVNKSADIIEQLVQQNLEELGLTGCADRLIGGGLIRGISGGEKKRASIGTELIFNPSVLFLDEPTTGLDSYTALKLAELLTFLAKKKNRTIVATIHQPNSQIFDRFDKLLLLKGGKTIYMGDAKEAVEYFAEIGHPLPLNYNPADHFLNVLSTFDINPRATINPLRGQTQSFHTEVDGGRVEVDFDKPRAHYIAGGLFAFYVLCRRNLLENLRNPMVLKVKFMKLVISALMACTLYYQLNDAHDCVSETSQGVSYMRTRCSAVFMLCANFFGEAISSTLTSFQMQKYVFFREYSEARYGIVPYFLSYNLIMFPLEVLWNLSFVVVCYWVMNINDNAENFLVMIGLAVIMGMCGTSFGMLCSIIAPNIELASVLSPLFVIPFNLTAGFLVTNNKIPDWFFLKYFSPFRYAFEVGVRNQFKNSNSDRSCIDLTYDYLHLPDQINDGMTNLIIIMVAFRIFSCFILWLKIRKL